MTYSSFVANWKRRMDEAYALANQKTQSSQHYNKTKYDSKARAVEIEVGDRVLVKNCRKSGTGKLATFWEPDVFVVTQKWANVPVFEVRKYGQPSSRVRVLHRNLLKSVNELTPPEPEKTGPGSASGRKKTGPGSASGRKKNKVEPRTTREQSVEIRDPLVVSEDNDSEDDDGFFAVVGHGNVSDSANVIVPPEDQSVAPDLVGGNNELASNLGSDSELNGSGGENPDVVSSVVDSEEETSDPGVGVSEDDDLRENLHVVNADSGGDTSEPDMDGVGENVDLGENPDADVGPVLDDSMDFLSGTDSEETILESTEAEPDPTTDESRYESTVEQYESDDSVNTDDFDSISESPPPNNPAPRRSARTRNTNPPPIFTYNKLGGEPSLHHGAAHSRR